MLRHINVHRASVYLRPCLTSARAAAGAAGKYKGLQGKRWLVMACENKVGKLANLIVGKFNKLACSACLASFQPLCEARTLPSVLPLPQVVMHDLASADSRDFSRSACFESKAPTALAFLLINLPTLAGYGSSGAAGGAAGQVRMGGSASAPCPQGTAVWEAQG